MIFMLLPDDTDSVTLVGVPGNNYCVSVTIIDDDVCTLLLRLANT